MKRLIQIAALSLAMFSAAVASADYRGSAMTAELKADLKARVERSNAWRTQIGGKPGDKMRPFTASSVRTIRLQNGARLHGGFMVGGKFSTKSGRTYIQRLAAPR